MTTQPKTPRLYGLSPDMARFQYGMATLLGLLPMFFFALGFLEANCFAIGLLIGLIQAPFIGLLIWNARRVKCSFSTDGVYLRNVVGRELRLSWDEIESFDSTPGHEGFVLCEPLQTPAARRLADTAGIRYNGASFYVQNEETQIAACRWIPMKALAGWLRRGDMLNDWDLYAPRLSAQYRAEQSQIAKQKEQTRDTLLVIAVISAMLIIPTVAIAASGDQIPAEILSMIYPLFTAFNTLMSFMLGLMLIAISVVNFRAAISKLANRRFGSGLMWGLASIFQVMLGLLAFGSLFGST